MGNWDWEAVSCFTFCYGFHGRSFSGRSGHVPILMSALPFSHLFSVAPLFGYQVGSVGTKAVITYMEALGCFVEILRVCI